MLTKAQRESLRLTLFKAFGYEVKEQAVADFHNSEARTKIVSCPARTSKSYAGWKDALPDVFSPGIELAMGQDAESMLCWIVAPNYDLAKEFDYAWSDLISRKQAVGFDYRITKSANAPKQGNMMIEIEWGKNRKGDDVKSVVEVKSATNEKSMQSEEVDVGILSEAARLPQIAWTKYLSTRCKRSIWPTTPDIEAAWIWEMIEMGAGSPELEIESFNFTGRANPKYDWKRYWTEHAKAESLVDGLIETAPRALTKPPSEENGHNCFDELSGCKAMKEDGFAEQFGGKWVFHRGRVVPLRERESEAGAPAHVIDYDYDWLPHATWVVSNDYGFADNAVSGFWAVGPDGHAHLRRCIYETELTPDVFVELISDEWDWIRDRFHIQRSRAHRFLGDPKKPEVEALMRRRGLPIFNVDKRAQADRHAGHQMLMNYLATSPATGRPGMTVHSDCAPIIKEWRTLRRNANVKSEGSAASFIGKDDGYDMARYFVMSRPAPTHEVTLDSNSFEAARRAIAARKSRQPVQATVPRSMQPVKWRAA